MSKYVFSDALSGSAVTCQYPGLDILDVQKDPEALNATSVFFPGCSMLNYGMPLVQAVYETLKQSGAVDGISLLCCGKILSYEPDGQAKRDAFEVQLRERLAGSSVKRLVCSCPNCVKALRDALSCDERTAGIQVSALSEEFSKVGYKLDLSIIKNILGLEVEAEDIKICVHDSCPDRETGEFAESVRKLVPEGALVETAHNRKRSLCCGSLARAAGKWEQAVELSIKNGDEGVEAGAHVMITPCLSCANLLTLNQRKIPVIHYLEALYSWHIDWSSADAYMKLRFLFEDANENRPFKGLDA